jgi:hypothetical protein
VPLVAAGGGPTAPTGRRRCAVGEKVEGDHRDVGTQFEGLEEVLTRMGPSMAVHSAVGKTMTTAWTSGREARWWSR